MDELVACGEFVRHPTNGKYALASRALRVVK
jgi:hypothetical protein